MIIHTAKTSLHNKIAVPGSYEVTFETSPSVHVPRLTSTLATPACTRHCSKVTAGCLNKCSHIWRFSIPFLPCEWGKCLPAWISLLGWGLQKCSSQCSSFFFHFYDISKVCFTFKPNSTFSRSTLKDVYLYTDPRHRCVNIKHDYWFTGGLAGALTRSSNAI